MHNTEYPLVSIISVNYNQTEVTLDMLDSLSNISYPNFEVWIVDNASRISPEVQILEHKLDVHFIRSKKNLGFAGGNNLAIRKAQGDYILFLNNDTEVEPDFLEPLVEVLQNDDQAGMVSPKIIYHNTENIIQYAGAIAINPYTGRGRKIGWMEEDLNQYNELRETQLGHGAAMLVKRDVIECVGEMPEAYFLYYEEHDWTEHMKREGYTVLYNGHSKIYHKESVSVGRVSTLKTYYMSRNRMLYIRRNVFGIKKLCALAFFLLLAVPKNSITYLIKGKFNHLSAFFKGLWWNIQNPTLNNISYES